MEKKIMNKKAAKNWWYYHKWYVVCGVILLGIVVHLICRAVGIGQTKPDFQIAYVGRTPLPADAVSSLEHAFASIGSDFNNDGKVTVTLHQYITTGDSPNSDAVYEYGSEIALIGDINDCESYFFLMDDPDAFQRGFHVLALPDGGCPDELDFTTDDKTILWRDCSLLSDMELGSYSSVILGQETTGSIQELMADLYIGRRCFYTDKTVAYRRQCDDVWNLLSQNNILLQKG